MKHLIVFAVILQISVGDVIFIKPEYDKLYPILELVEEKMQEFLVIEISWIEKSLAVMLPKYKEFMKTESYTDYKEAIQYLLSVLQELVKDPENCQVQSDVEAALFDAIEIELEYDEFLEDILLLNNANMEEDETPILDIFQQFPGMIRKFLKSLNAKEKKEKYAELYKYSKEILKAADMKERFDAVEKFLTKVEDEYTNTRADNICKWDLLKYISFMKNLMEYYGIYFVLFD